ncbi:MAG: hypothetical protein OXH69_07865 [Acidobacteria bacterium]|nr:hypothetical protein [Acidobacteriota bacterium]
MARIHTPSRGAGGAAALLLAAGALAAASAATAGQEPVGTTMHRLYAPVEIGADVAALPASERAALARIVDAARVMDALFLEQVWPGNPTVLMALLDDRSSAGQARLDYFLANKGPWSRLENDRPFVAGVPSKPPGAAYYPPDATREELAAWFDDLSGEARRAAIGFFTTIRRGPAGVLRAVPYSVEYQGPLAVAAEHLRAAAELTAEPTLARYLRSRAVAFASNDYYQSDVDWMQLDSAIEPTIGPYEVYEDGWFNYKAAFEAFVTIRDDDETAQLARFGAELQGLEDALPVDPAYRDPELGALAPIRVVNVVFTAGDANSGVQTAAFNLPNDERVIRDHGSKRVMLKNVQEAKFRHVLTPIAAVALPPAERADVSFDAFFTHILMHELMHGLGPQEVTVDGGRAATVREALRETSSVVEEAKADISGLWALHRLIDQGVIDRSLERSIYTTFLASSFRSIRFGINAAHGRGVAIQLNTFLDAGAVTVDSNGRFAVDHGRIRDAVEGLTRRLMTIQAHGDYDAAVEVLETLGVVRPEVQRVLDRLGGVPVDIRPRYVTADALATER